MKVSAIFFAIILALVGKGTAAGLTDKLILCVMLHQNALQDMFDKKGTQVMNCTKDKENYSDLKPIVEMTSDIKDLLGQCKIKNRYDCLFKILPQVSSRIDRGVQQFRSIMTNWTQCKLLVCVKTAVDQLLADFSKVCKFSLLSLLGIKSGDGIK